MSSPSDPHDPLDLLVDRPAPASDAGPPTDGPAPANGSATSGGRRRWLVVGLLAAALVALAGVAWTTWLAGPDEVVAIDGASADVVFVDPDRATDAGREVTRGPVEVRAADGTVELTGTGEMVVDAAHPGRNTLTVEPDGDWVTPHGLDGTTIADPVVEAEWDADAGRFTGQVTGTPTGAAADRVAPPPVTAISGPNDARAALPAPDPDDPTAVVGFDDRQPVVRSAPVSLGPIDLGPLHVDDVTLGVEAAPDGSRTIVVGLQGVSGAIGPVSIVDADGTVRLPEGEPRATLTLAGTLGVGGSTGPFSLDVPAALNGTELVLGPDAHLALPLGDGLEVTADVTVALAPEPGDDLVVADATVTYGTFTAEVDATITAATSDAAGPTARLALAAPLDLGGGVVVDEAVLTWDGSAVGLTGAARFTDPDGGTDLSVAVDGTVTLDGATPAFSLRTEADGTLALAGRTVALAGGLTLAGTLGGPIDIVGDLLVADTRVAVTGSFVADGDTTALTLAARGDVEADVALTIDRAAGTVTGDLTVARLAVAGHEVTDAELHVAHGPDATRVELAVGRLLLPSGRTATVEGSIVAADGVVTLTIDGETDLLGPVVTASGTVTLGAGRLDVDLTVAAGTTVALGGEELALGGEVHLEGNLFDRVDLTATVDLVGNRIAARGTLALDGGALALALEGTGGATELSLDARYDLAAGHLAGTARLAELTVGAATLTEASVEVDLGGDADRISVDATATLGATTTVAVSGDLTLGDGVTRLDAEGTATLNGIDVAVAGWVEMADDAVTFDVTATADDVRIPLGGDDLALSGAVRLSGTVGEAFALDATVEVYGRSIEVTGTVEADDGRLAVTVDATDGEGTLRVEVEVVDGDVTGTVTIDRLVLGEVTVTNAELAVSSVDGVLTVELEGDVAWRDGHLAVTGAVTRDADGTLAIGLSAEGELPLGAGVTLTEVVLGSDGTTIDLSGRARVLTARVDATVAVTGTVTLGATPTFDLLTAADGTIALDDDSTLAVTGALRIRSGEGPEVLVDGTLSTLDQTLAFAGSLSVADGAVAVALRSTDESTVTFGLDLTVDIASRSAEGHLRVDDLRLGDLQVVEADLTISLAEGALDLRLTGEARFGESLLVEVDAAVEVDGSRITLRFTGLAAFLDRFVDVGVTGTVVVDGTVTYDIAVDAAASLDFTGQGDLFIDGGLRLFGTIGQPVGIEGDITALGNRLAFAGTFTLGVSGVDLRLEDTEASTTTFRLDLTVSRDGASGAFSIGAARLDVFTVDDLSVEVEVDAEGAFTGTLTAAAQLADRSGRLAGITDARARIGGIVTRSAEGVYDIGLQATIDRLETTGEGVSAIVGDLDLDYLDVVADITRAAEGEPFTARVTATVAATTLDDGTIALPDVAAEAGNARIGLDGTLTFTEDGVIGAWTLAGDVENLTYRGITLDARFEARGDGLDQPAVAEVAGDIVAVGGKVTGRLEGTIGYSSAGSLQFDITGTVGVRGVAGLDADLDVRITGDGTLAFDGGVQFGPLGGDANGRIELIRRADGVTWPRLDMRVGAWHAGRGAVLDKWWGADTSVAFLDVSLSNWDDPDTYRFSATGLGAGSVNIIAGLADGAALAGLQAEGTLRDNGGQPSFDLSVRAGAGGGAQVLGFLYLAAGGAAELEVRGSFQNVSVEGRALAVAVAGVGPVALPVGAGVDVSFQADLTGDQVYEVRATAHAGVSILGPVITARGDVALTGTVDLARKQATFSADVSASGNVLLVVARGSARGRVDLQVDWATPGAPAVVTGTARVEIDASVLFWRVAGFHADLVFDGSTLWVTGGDKFLSGDGLINRKRRVVNLRGTLWPNERLCGDRQVKRRFGGWKGDGSWGDCGGQGSATGRVVTDTDGSGGASPGDRGVGGVTVELRASDGSPIGSTVTADNGTWRFDELGAGIGYQAVVILPPDQALVADPDGTPDGLVGFTAGNGEVRQLGSWVIGTTPPTGGLTGRVVEDVGGDGSPDGDPGLGDVMVRVAGPVSTTVRTGVDGSWSVGGLTAGTYTVEVVRPTYTVTVDPDGTVDGRVTVVVEADRVGTVGTVGLHSDGLPPTPADPSPSTEAPAPTPTPDRPRELEPTPA